MTNTYEIKSTKQLNTLASGLTKSIKGLNSRLQGFVGSFIVSYNDNKDNNPFNSLMQTLASEKTFIKTKTQIINWISENTNYKVKWNKDSNYYGITYKDEKNKTLVVGENFYLTNFYDKKDDEESEKDNTKYESIDKGLKSFDKTWIKLYNTIQTADDRTAIRNKLTELLAMVTVSE